jgi:signal peptidase I
MSGYPAWYSRLILVHLPSTGLRRGLVFAAAAIALCCVLPARLAVTLGRSMEPTLRNGQPFLFAPRQAADEPLQRGEIVVLRIQNVPCVKRVAAIGGETLWIAPTSKENSAPLWALDSGEDPQVWKKRFPWLGLCRYRVPADTVFVVGDSPVSQDSRQLGPIRMSEVMGRVTWPRLPNEPLAPTFLRRLMPRRPSSPAQDVRIARR